MSPQVTLQSATTPVPSIASHELRAKKAIAPFIRLPLVLRIISVPFFIFAQGMGASYLGVAETVIQVSSLFNHGRQACHFLSIYIFSHGSFGGGGGLFAQCPPFSHSSDCILVCGLRASACSINCTRGVKCRSGRRAKRCFAFRRQRLCCRLLREVYCVCNHIPARGLAHPLEGAAQFRVCYSRHPISSLVCNFTRVHRFTFAAGIIAASFTVQKPSCAKRDCGGCTVVSARISSVWCPIVQLCFLCTRL
jgi:hypothetical protein